MLLRTTMPQDRGKAEEADDMLLPFAERSIEGRESNEERADLPHRVLGSLPRTRVWPSGGAVALVLFAKARANGARTQNPPPKTRNSTYRSLKSEPIIVPREGWTPPNGSRLSCGAKLKWSQLEFYYAGCRPFSGLV